MNGSTHRPHNQSVTHYRGASLGKLKSDIAAVAYGLRSIGTETGSRAKAFDCMKPSETVA